MGPSWVQILIVVVLVVLLFGRGKISDLMGDVATGIKSFRKGLKDEDQSGTAAADSLKTIDNETGEKISPSTKGSPSAKDSTSAKDRAANG